MHKFKNGDQFIISDYQGKAFCEVQGKWVRIIKGNGSETYKHNDWVPLSYANEGQLDTHYKILSANYLKTKLGKIFYK